MTKTPPPSLAVLSFLLFILPFHVNSQTINGQEQSILLNLKQYWSNPSSIDHWAPSSNSTAHCSWPGITCTGSSVTGIALFNIGIAGDIPPFICDLKNLTTIDLSFNEIPGPFPTVLYSCSNLQYLDLSQNFFVGRIPADIDRLSPRLQYLSLSANNFTGDIPAAIARFPELTTLSLYQNLFNGSFPPEIGNLSNLEFLELAFNGFAPSTIPGSFANLTKLRSLYMTESKLIGEIPESIGSLTALEFIDLSVNDLSGNIPRGFFLLKNLTEIYLYRNRLTGSIPQSVEALNLKIIDLSENNLTGPIPEGFGNQTKLTNLTLLYNQLSGAIPDGISRLPELKNVRLFGNNLSGRIPPDFGRFSKLIVFEVDINQLVGGLPENLCAGGVLAGAVASNNYLSGEIPKSLGNCSSLLILQVFNNRFFGRIPDGLWTSPNMMMLRLSDNFFTGQLPETISPNLTLIEISNNNFSGEIPASVSSWNNLKELKASNNLFVGTIPQELTSLPFLATLLLDWNQLSGQFPSNIISWTSLSSLNLSHNQLHGEIPAGLGFLPVLTELDLSANDLSGQIPADVGKLRLTSLNLSSNLLIGKLPGSFENGAFENSFLNNPGLCTDNPSLGLQTCRSNPRNTRKISSQFIIVVTSIAVVVLVAALLFSLYLIKNFRKEKRGLDTWKLTSFQRLSFTESTILSSLTDNNTIGSGGSGKVYRVAINRSGESVAVKRIWTNKKLDHHLEKQFNSEVEILSTIRHSNIVKLMCCISSEKSKLLVYPYFGNQSLDQWLHGKERSLRGSASVHHVVLDWPKRLQIAVGAARGLCYMHHDCLPPIIHRDVKSSNILLDSEFNAKIADFGLARILIKDGGLNTMSAVAGSFGYIAPEYAQTTRVNEKIDVYSFGVVLLELVTGKEANKGDEDTNLAEWAWQHIQKGYPIADALDSDIKEPCYLDEMVGIFKLGIICTGTLPSTRPSMKEVLQILLRCSPMLAFGEKNVASEVDSLPLLKNSKRERELEGENDGLGSIV
ncbi:hypothetical protein LguiA_005043 [Lonicera macranthoides]